jgi:hypothetical protein
LRFVRVATGPLDSDIGPNQMMPVNGTGSTAESTADADCPMQPSGEINAGSEIGNVNGSLQQQTFLGTVCQILKLHKKGFIRRTDGRPGEKVFFKAAHLWRTTRWDSLLVGSRVAFRLGQNSRGPIAVDVRLVKRARATLVIMLEVEESANAPATDLEARSAQQFLSRRLATYQNFAREVSEPGSPSPIRTAAAVYMEAMASFQRKQREAQAASLRSNTARCDADVAARMAAQHDACLQLLLDAPSPLTRQHLQEYIHNIEINYFAIIVCVAVAAAVVVI